MKKKKTSGWFILNSGNSLVVKKIVGKIKITVERGDYLGKQNIRLSKKALDEAFDLLDKKAQRVRKNRRINNKLRK